MDITLFEHNEKAYRKAVEMLADKGKAAIIHPTGTGKSFIGFKLCADNEDKLICWLSPSEYIFETQIDNLKELTNGYVPDNIRFYTYAKLAYMSDEELESIKPDYIILDEFHRCGAEVWGVSVYKLLSIYDKVPVLGLSATAIRYLDNQRDMADELFDGLENTLTSPWDSMYLEAKKYYENNGDLKVTLKYVTETGYPLGRWIGTQRTNRRKGDVCLTEERIEKLDAIGMVWDYADKISWEKGYGAACSYYAANGNLNIPATYITEDGFKLGNWFRHIKIKYNEGKLDDSYIELLEKIGINWEAITLTNGKRITRLGMEFKEV